MSLFVAGRIKYKSRVVMLQLQGAITSDVVALMPLITCSSSCAYQPPQFHVPLLAVIYIHQLTLQHTFRTWEGFGEHNVLSRTREHHPDSIEGHDWALGTGVLLIYMLTFRILFLKGQWTQIISIILNQRYIDSTYERGKTLFRL